MNKSQEVQVVDMSIRLFFFPAKEYWDSEPCLGLLSV